jgi:uncharacterized protein YdeI (YjbR/CyaY-like superfamily)
MGKLTLDPKAIKAFSTAKLFRDWLEKNHDKRSEIYLRVYKKGSGHPSITIGEALDEALCWGWIDAIRHAYDEHSYLQRYTPRTPRSIWSQINRDHVARLIAEKRMTPHGLKQVKLAQADGRWDAAYASAKTMTIPDDLLVAIKAEPKALALFERLDRTNLYALAFRLAQLKTPAGRTKRIASFVAMLARGETLHPLRVGKKAK